MERVEKLLLLAVLSVAVIIIAVLAFLPDPGTEAPGTGAGSSGNSGSVAADASRIGNGSLDPKAADQNGLGQGGTGSSVTGSSVTGSSGAGQGTGLAKGKLQDSDLQSSALKKLFSKLPSVDGKGQSGAGTAVASGPATSGGAGSTDGPSTYDPDGGVKQGQGGSAALPLPDSGNGQKASATRRVSAAMYYNQDYWKYAVKSGDVLGAILNRYVGHSGPKTIARFELANEGIDVNRLIAGQEILIPKDLVVGELSGLEPVSMRGERWRPLTSAASLDASTMGGSERGASPSRKRAFEPVEDRGAVPAGPSRGAPTRRAARGGVEASGNFVVIKDGDTLWGIGASRVGRKKAESYAKRMARLNAKLIREAGGTIKRGMRLALPK